MRDMNISVVIPVKDRPEPLARVVQAVLDQSCQPAELIIVDQSETPICKQRIQELLQGRRDHPELIYIHNPRIDGLTAARQEGVRRSTSEVIVFLDDDGIPSREAIELLAESLSKNSSLVAVGGIINNYKPPVSRAILLRRIFMRGDFWDERQPIYWNWSRYSRGELVQTNRLNGGLMAFRRKTLEAVGGFDLGYRGACVGEDVEISQRLLKHTGRRNSIALVGGAHLQHESLGLWKERERSWETELVASHYIFRKNGTAPNVARFLWFTLGLFLMAVGAAIRHRKMSPLRSLLSGIRCIRTDYSGCPFIKPPTRSVSSTH